MFLAKFTFFIALWLSVFNFGYVESGDVSSDDLPSPIVCLNCSICQYPCHPLPPPPPPLSGYPLYGAPPPPPPSPSDSPSYGAPPPLGTPSPPEGQGNCPPTPIVQCCHYPPPTPYGYTPYDNYSASSLPFSFFSVMFLLFCFAALFQV